MQIIGVILLVLVLGLTTFYFVASSSTLEKGQYIKYVTYDVESRSYQSGDTLRAITYNIGYLSGMTNNRSVERKPEVFEENLNIAENLYLEYRPDVAGFQEIDFNAHRSFFKNQAEHLGSQTGFGFGFHSVNWDKKYVPFPFGTPSNHFKKIVSGQSILSRHELRENSHIVLDMPRSASFYYKAFYLNRLIQISDWMVGDQVIKVMNLHLEAFDAETRMIQAERVREEYLKYYKNYPVLIMGDFNSLPHWLDNDAMRIIMNSPDIASAIDKKQYELDSTSYYTFSSAEPSYMIDYILYNQSYIQKIDARVLQEAGQVSDHLPLLFDFILTR